MSLSGYIKKGNTTPLLGTFRGGGDVIWVIWASWINILFCRDQTTHTAALTHSHPCDVTACSRRRGWGKAASPNTPTCPWSCTYSSRCSHPCPTPTCAWRMPWRRSRSSCSPWVWLRCFVVSQWEFSVDVSVRSSLPAANIHRGLRRWNYLCNRQPRAQKGQGCKAKIHQKVIKVI